MAASLAALKLEPADLERLRAGAAELGVALDEEAARRFRDYVDLLDRWRRATNLISCATPRELVDRHLLDALACAWPCQAAAAIADLGSGAGLPGVPLAIVAPARRTVLVEPRGRRATFLREVRRVLGLSAVEVVEARVEDFSAADIVCVDVAVCRAVWSTDEALAVAAPWVRAGGLLLSMRAVGDSRPLAAGTPHLTAPTFTIREQTLTYRVGAEIRGRIDVFRKPC